MAAEGEERDSNLDWTIDELHRLYVDEFKKGCGYGCPNGMSKRRGTYCISALCFVEWLARNGKIKILDEKILTALDEGNKQGKFMTREET